MTAYNPITLFNILLKKKVKYWSAQQLITEKQSSAILNEYKIDCYTPNVFIRILFFILTCFILSSIFGIYFLLFSSSLNSLNDNVLIFTFFVFTIGCFIVLELFIKKVKVYKSGIDEALLYAGLICLSTTLFFLSHNVIDNNYFIYTLVLLPGLIFSIIRYTDRFVTLVAALCIYFTLFLLLLKLGDVAKMLMPFAIMLFSAVIFFQSRKYKQNEKLIYWKSCITVIECISLFIFYVACNYFVIRESSISFFDLHLEVGQDIPFAFLFYILTALVPLLYIYFGLKIKDKLILWTGLIVLIFAAITFKYYFSLGHTEITLTVAGIILILVAYLSIKYLKTPKYGISIEDQYEADHFFKTNAEALVIAQSFTQQTTTSQSSDDISLGGGESGGAGSGGTF